MFKEGVVATLIYLKGRLHGHINPINKVDLLTYLEGLSHEVGHAPSGKAKWRLVWVVALTNCLKNFNVYIRTILN
jgi:hypothetical protein